MSKGDQVKICLVGLKGLVGCPEGDTISCLFDWTAKEYSTTLESVSDGNVEWKEEYEIFVHPVQHKVIRFEVRDSNQKPLGKCQIDLGHLKTAPGAPSDAWYPLGKLDGALPYSGFIRVILKKAEQIKLTPMAVSAVLPTLDASQAEQVEADYVASLTKEEREAFYNQGGLRKAVHMEDDGISDDGGEVALPTGMRIPKFWELKQMFPGLDDRQIYLAMNKFDPFDMNKTIEYIQAKQNKQARQIHDKLLLDGGALAAPPPMDPAQIARNAKFLAAAQAGDLMNVEINDLGMGVADESRRKALLIGCDYKKLGGAWELNGGPLKDIRRVRSWLEGVWGFANEEGRMMMMADDHPQPPCRPSKGNMVRALEWLGRDCKPGDSLFVYFAGHGGSTMMPEGTPTHGFEGEVPFWYGIDGKQLFITDIYEQLLTKIPESVRVTFVVDAPNWHLWQPFYFDPLRREESCIMKTSHQYFLQSDIHVFSSLATAHTRSGGTFTNAFLNLTSGSNMGKSKYQLLSDLNNCLNRNFKVDMPKKIEQATGAKLNYYTCSQKTDMSMPFDLNSWTPNLNVQIGMKPTRLSAAFTPSAPAPAPEMKSGPISFKLNIKSTPNNTPPPPVQNLAAGQNDYGITSPGGQKPVKAFGADNRRVSVREQLRAMKKEYKDEKAAKKPDRQLSAVHE